MIEEFNRILVVEDNKMTQQVLQALLGKQDYVLTFASNGLHALELLDIEDSSKAPAYDLILLDIMMPKLDGMAVLERVREFFAPEELPIIMTSALSDSSGIISALSMGANDYVMKPFDGRVLSARIKTHLDFLRTHVALQRAQASLIDSAKLESIGRIAAGVAHEVKNPLYVIQMGIDYFSMALDEEDETVQRTINNMQNAIDRADTIIRTMVDFSRADELKLSEVQINDLVDHALYLILHEVKSRGIELEKSFEEGLPILAVDRTKIEQVVINLSSNACHAMESGGRLFVKVSGVKPDSEDLSKEEREAMISKNIESGVRIEVVDEGTGVSEKMKLKLFQPFYTSKPAGKGSGLGLSVTKTIVDLHGGYIGLNNNNDCKGARACVILNTNSDAISASKKLTSEER